MAINTSALGSIVERAFSTGWQYIVGFASGAAFTPSNPMVGGTAAAVLASLLKNVVLPILAQYYANSPALFKSAVTVIEDAAKDPAAKPLIAAAEANPVVAKVEAAVEPVVAQVEAAVPPQAP